MKSLLEDYSLTLLINWKEEGLAINTTPFWINLETGIKKKKFLDQRIFN